MDFYTYTAFNNLITKVKGFYKRTQIEKITTFFSDLEIQEVIVILVI